jgi:HEAT repeat protein
MSSPSHTNAEIAALLHDLRGRYAIPRKRAIEKLAEIGVPAVPGLIETLNGKNAEAAEAAADALVRIGTPEARDAVEQWRNL